MSKIFLSGIFQNYLVFIQDNKYIKCFNGTTHLWKSNRISAESIENITKSNSVFAPTFFNHYVLNFNKYRRKKTISNK